MGKVKQEVRLEVTPNREELAVIQNVAEHVVIKLKLDYNEPLRYIEEEDLYQEFLIVGLKAYPKWGGRGKKFRDVYEGGYGKGVMSLRLFIKKALVLHSYKVVYLGKMDCRIANYIPEKTIRLDEEVRNTQDNSLDTQADVYLPPTIEDPDLGALQKMLREYQLPETQLVVALEISRNGLGKEGLTYKQLSERVDLPVKEVKKAVRSMERDEILHELLLELRN